MLNLLLKKRILFRVRRKCRETNHTIVVDTGQRLVLSLNGLLILTTDLLSMLKSYSTYLWALAILYTRLSTIKFNIPYSNIKKKSISENFKNVTSDQFAKLLP